LISKKGLIQKMQIAEIVSLLKFSAHSVERMKSYIINTFFSLPNGKTHKSVISKHEHVHAKLYLQISKFCMYAATFGCKVYAFWVHVYGSVGCKVCGSWVQSLWILLGACLCLLGACLWLGWVHVCGCWVHA